MKVKYKGIKRTGIGKSSASKPTGSDEDFANFGGIKSNTYTKNPAGGPDYNGPQGVPGKVKKGDEGGRDGDGYYVEEALGWKRGDVAKNRDDNTGSKKNYSAKFDNDTDAFVANHGHTEPREKAEAVRILMLQKESPLWPKGAMAEETDYRQGFRNQNNKNRSGFAAGSPQTPVKAGGKTKGSGINGANDNKGMALGKSGNRGGFIKSKGSTYTSYGMKKPFINNKRLG